ncbi:MAG: hypothetical protein V1837_08100 [Candidatus Woesearchaeota archaeon]
MNKKAVNFYKDWAEILAGVLLVLGFILALTTGSKVMSYLVITLCGMMFGRLWHKYKKNFQFTWFLVILGFIIGYLLGNYYGSTYTTITLFLVGIMISYYMHDKKIIKTVGY